MTREEAIEVYNGLINTKIKEAFEFFAPELRESEDERIRKGIIEIIKAVSGPDCDVYLDEKKQEKYIAWLEKQKEQEHICDSAQYEEGFKTGLEIGLRRQKEQKPAEWNANDKAFIKDCANILVANDYAASAERLLSMFPVKPAEWSEEDEEMLEEIINHIDTTSVQRIPARPGSAIGKSWIKFLKSIRPQPKQEWSEEDENMMQYVIGSIDTNISDSNFKNIKIWCKSIKDRVQSKPQWRPSEEQMNALLNAEEYLREGDQFDSAKSIAKLYNQLKAL